MPTHQLDSLDVADLMDYYLQNPADSDVTDTDQPDPEADTESDPEVDTEPDQEADIESDQEAYIELSDLESDPEVGELLPAPRRTDRHQEADIESDQETYIELSDLEADLEVGESLPAPPTDRQFATIDEATAAINKFTGENGYAVSKRRSKVDKKGDLNKIYFQCNRGRVFQSQVKGNERKRNRCTRRIDCPFSMVLSYSKSFDSWSLKIREASHNHGPSPISTHPVLRREEVNTHSEAIKRHLSVGTRTSHILTMLRQSDPANSIKPRDIHNLRARLRTEFLDGRTPIQALLYQIPEEGDWIMNYQATDNVVTAVFCTHKSALEILRDSHYVLVIDATYKTNRYNMPMVDIVGVTPLNKTFFVGFGFIQSEKEPFYRFILRDLHDIYRQLNLPDPRVVLTDKEKALMNAIEAEFPFTKCMLCIWHVNKNILAKARAFLRRDTLSLFRDNDPQFLPRLKEKEKAMLGLWMSVVYAGTLPDMEEAWRKFQAEYNTEMYAEVVMYIKSEWMESDTARRLLHAYTSSYLHLGNQATSRGEAAHWCLK